MSDPSRARPTWTRRCRDLRWRAGIPVALVLALGGCTRRGAGVVPVAEHRDVALTEDQGRYLQALANAADADPSNVAAQKASGLAHLRFTLSGVLSLRERAERDLEAAFDLRHDDPELDRILGRFYNMRAVEGDVSKAERQVEVYAALLGDRAPAELTTRDFVAWSFFQLGQILVLKSRGRLLQALATVRDLEDALARRVQSDPDDVEILALAGNFAFFFAGNIPMDKVRRVRDATGYFTQVRARWNDLRTGARDPDHCPNTYENFMFELAEGFTVLGERARAIDLYRELSTVRSPATRAKEQIAFVSAERIAHYDSYEGDLALMPPWPSDVGNCVVCHAYTSDVPMASLHSIEPIALDQIPSSAEPKPIVVRLDVPADVRRRVAQHCVRCHRPGGEAAAAGDFTTDEGVVGHARSMLQRVRTGEMPPGQPLPAEAVRVWTKWLDR